MILAWAAATWACAQVSASAHDFWETGEPVPPWVKSVCCGPEDVHHLKPGAVHLEADGYHIDGIETVVPVERALPSPDGGYWGFWSPYSGTHPLIYCFFAPQLGT